MSDYPVIYDKNYVNADDTFTVSHSAASFVNAYDRDPDSRWITSGANSDLTTVTIDIEFYEGDVAATRSVNRLCLMNHNLKTWTFYYWDGAAWQSLASEAADAASTTCKTFGAQSTTKVRLQVTATQSANAEKALGELVVTSELFAFPVPMNRYARKDRQKVKRTLMGDGALQRTTVRWSPNRSSKYQATVAFEYLDAASVASLKAIKQDEQPFLWYPEPTTAPTDLFFVHWDNEWAERYSSPVKTAGKTLELVLVEK